MPTPTEARDYYRRLILGFLKPEGDQGVKNPRSPEAQLALIERYPKLRDATIEDLPSILGYMPRIPGGKHRDDPPHLVPFDYWLFMYEQWAVGDVYSWRIADYFQVYQQEIFDLMTALLIVGDSPLSAYQQQKCKMSWTQITPCPSLNVVLWRECWSGSATRTALSSAACVAPPATEKPTPLEHWLTRSSPNARGQCKLPP